jgi:hypothetical protein
MACLISSSTNLPSRGRQDDVNLSYSRLTSRDPNGWVIYWDRHLENVHCHFLLAGVVRHDTRVIPGTSRGRNSYAGSTTTCLGSVSTGEGEPLRVSEPQLRRRKGLGKVTRAWASRSSRWHRTQVYLHKKECLVGCSFVVIEKKARCFQGIAA